MSIVKRGLTIAIGAPIAVGLTLHPTTVTILVWVATMLAMIEWTAVKRHLKVVLLSTLPKPSGAAPGVTRSPVASEATNHSSAEEYATPVAKTNAFIVVKCVLSTLPVPCCAMSSPEYFHLASTLYFFFWVVFTLSFQNQLEHTTYIAKKRVEATPSPPSDTVVAKQLKWKQQEEFALQELEMIAAHPVANNFLSFALEYFGFVWILGLAHGALMVFHVPEYGRVCAITVLVSNWANDAFALIVGRTLKGHTVPLYPKISPNKSREGAVAGVLANGAVAAAMASTWPAIYELDWGPTPVWISFFVVGIFFGVLGVIGDLLQSLFKRTARVKDTGSLLPGHGGILDRIDGLLLTFPAAYWMLWLFVRWPSNQLRPS